MQTLRRGRPQCCRCRMRSRSSRTPAARRRSDARRTPRRSAPGSRVNRPRRRSPSHLRPKRPPSARASSPTWTPTRSRPTSCCAGGVLYHDTLDTKPARWAGRLDESRAVKVVTIAVLIASALILPRIIQLVPKLAERGSGGPRARPRDSAGGAVVSCRPARNSGEPVHPARRLGLVGDDFACPRAPRRRVLLPLSRRRGACQQSTACCCAPDSEGPCAHGGRRGISGSHRRARRLLRRHRPPR